MGTYRERLPRGRLEYVSNTLTRPRTALDIALGTNLLRNRHALKIRIRMG